MSESTLSPEVSELLERIIQKVEIDVMTPELHDRMLRDLSRELDDYLIAGAIDALPDDQLDAYEAMVEKQATRDELQQFFSDHIENLNEVLTQAVMDFKNHYLAPNE